MSDKDAAPLFDDSVRTPDGRDHEADRKPGPVLFVTNRFNLLEFLSVGLIVPRPALAKYYADLLAIRPDRLPLVRGPVHRSIVESVSAESATAFPVALEVDPSRLDGTKCAAMVRGKAARLADSSVEAWAPGGVLPLSAVTCVHFRSQGDLEEHTAREYDNVPRRIPFIVTPALFDGGELTCDQLKDFLEKLPARKVDLIADLERADRTTGACVLALRSAPADQVAIEQLVKMISGAEKAKLVPTDGPLPAALALALAQTGADVGPGADSALFELTISVLRKIDRAGSWRPLDVVRKIEGAVAEAALAESDATEIAKNLRPISAILRNDRDFRPFEPGVGLDSAKALLLVLLRPEPDRLLSWQATETGADAAVSVLAAALCGLLRGRKKLSLNYRDEALDVFLANRISSHVASLETGALRPVKSRARISVKMVGAAKSDEKRVVVRFGDVTLVEKTLPPLRLIDLLRDADLSRSAIRSVALGVCRELGWLDCVTTVVRSSACDVRSNLKREPSEFRFPGLVEVELELDDGRFRAALDAEVRLSPEAESRFLAKLRDV